MSYIPKHLQKLQPGSSTKQRPVTRNNPDMAALNDLLNTMNNPNILGVEPPEEKPKGEDALLAAAAIRAEQKTEINQTIEQVDAKLEPAPVPEQADAPKPTVAPRALFFTGRTNVGKDYVAKASGATIFGFAEPLYAIASHYFGVEVSSSAGKELPGMREFLQVIGQWGRALVSDKYPLTTNRASFINMIRTQACDQPYGIAFPEVKWVSFGANPDIWIDACVVRVQAYLRENPEARAAITNCRFEGEFKRLQLQGFQHWHIMASQKTWSARLAQQRIAPDSPALKDVSETLAAQLDNSVVKQVSAQKVGPQLRCVWNDETVVKPSPRLHTLETFLQSVR